MNSPEAILRHLYDCYKRGDLSEFPRYVDESCEWIFPGAPEIVPWAGNFRGLEFFEFAQRVAGSIEYEVFDVHTYHSAGDTVVALFHERCRVKSTSKVFENDVAAIATFKDGRATHYREYGDTGAIERAFAP